jgi:hypothetical protein
MMSTSRQGARATGTARGVIRLTSDAQARATTHCPAAPDGDGEDARPAVEVTSPTAARKGAGEACDARWREGEQRGQSHRR